jgi:hypothetical protein
MAERAALLLALALPLAGVDLLHKALAATPPWAYHERGPAWIALSGCVALGCLGLVRVPSRAVAAAAGLLAAGALGNGVAALLWERGIPNPLVWESRNHVAAFNLADLFTLSGIAFLMVLLGSLTIRSRERLLPPRAFARMLWERLR